MYRCAHTMLFIGLLSSSILCTITTEKKYRPITDIDFNIDVRHCTTTMMKKTTQAISAFGKWHFNRIQSLRNISIWKSMWSIWIKHINAFFPLWKNRCYFFLEQFVFISLLFLSFTRCNEWVKNICWKSREQKKKYLKFNIKHWNWNVKKNDLWFQKRSHTKCESTHIQIIMGYIRCNLRLFIQDTLQQLEVHEIYID